MKKDFDLELMKRNFENIASIDDSSLRSELWGKDTKHGKTRYLHRKEIKLPKAFTDKLQKKRYSESTVKTYSAYFKDFMHHFSGRNLNEITIDEINDYILSLIQLSIISGSEQNQRINAIKFYYEKVLGREKQVIQIERPRKEKILPDTFSKEEIQLLLQNTANIKHRCMLELLYSAGLRRAGLTKRVHLHMLRHSFATHLLEQGTNLRVM